MSARDEHGYGRCDECGAIVEDASEMTPRRAALGRELLAVVERAEQRGATDVEILGALFDLYSSHEEHMQLVADVAAGRTP